ncbi:Bifunctional protein BirA [Marine Group I thaumarchaeote SCGC AAA799-E16]|uniref:Bifunctional protein BirA n=5 Tax=Marine Group I TaxID=905826 RepID=A0A087S7C7_9ARCH|nr:Bifunctional protein BirA [Marine Group I thaumarchaeote SCGC AAA799-N04]KER05919.1 Bifunctional protein BirA [Marine Group I thaumarchaeote SCGC AAA799-E16]KFM16022.1 Bifunctional protein BirA [Marine Group I thaumarchaeote SCGC AAA799-D11]KFM17759.1 Bifunctional protein BirA [Marine Group I thaumarchaeote SCGC RSA3]KFM21631.1 Bifunctional protein BirA [Marine Group I thaumarchaeote SCGC AAA799-B03]
MIYNSFDNPGLVKVLTFLQTHNTEYLSGQDLSDVLHISRVAVWKHIKKIQELGYTVESKQKLGYKLTKNSDALLPWEITSGLKTKTIGQQAFYFDSTDSTQNQALKMAEESENNGAIIVAEKQTGGRGRSGRKWISPKGGIWFSVILHPKFDISITTLFPIASALALSIALEKTFNISPELKWPNDITIKGKKLAGMLVDVSLESNKIENLVLGVGINFDVDVKQIEKNLKGTPNFYGVASLNEQKTKIKPIELVQSFLTELEKIYKSLEAKQTRKIISEWTKRSSTIGKNVKLNTVDGEIKGKALRIDEDGALVVSNNKNSNRVIAGDIIHITK